ncbi:MAG: DNA gyrase C-terminal beta-propeller domain-containing protein, partial [Pseudomonadota bacterium]
DMVLTITHEGYIKRVPLSTYRAQRRGGKGRAGMRTRDEDFVDQVYVVNTHTPVLFFSSLGQVYKLKVYRLPLGTPQARGKAMVNVLPLSSGETISIILPLPEEENWPDLHIMLATASGNVRRNSLADFVNVKANGKIAMKLDDGDRLVGVTACSDDQDVLLATRTGKCIRFPVGDVRVFSGRTSTGVRGIRLADGDEIISMSMLTHAAAETTDQRDDYLRCASAARRLASAEGAGEPANPEDEALAARLSDPAFEVMAEQEEFILGVTNDGFGKRTSAYEYRISGRGGSGIATMDLSRGAKVPDATIVGAFPVDPTDELVLVTNGGQIIRTPVSDIRIAGRSTRGVTLFRVDEDEEVVSVSRLDETDDDTEDAEASQGEVVSADEGPGGEVNAANDETDQSGATLDNQGDDDPSDPQ